jgi:hypothetical protein
MNSLRLNEIYRNLQFRGALLAVIAGVAISGCSDEMPGDPIDLPATAEYKGVENRPEKRTPEFGEDEPFANVRVWRVPGEDFSILDCPEGQDFGYDMLWGLYATINKDDVTEFVDVWCELEDKPVH